MAFIEIEDLYRVIREYNLDALTDGDDQLAEEAIEAAIEEVSSALVPNDKKEWQDGRPHYDVEAIFNTTGAQRNALMVRHTVNVALWHLSELSNTGVSYEIIVDRYDRATNYLAGLAKGNKNSRTLPKVTAPPPPDELPYGFGSMTKFNHE